MIARTRGIRSSLQDRSEEVVGYGDMHYAVADVGKAYVR